MGEAVPLNIAPQSTSALSTTTAVPTTTIATMLTSVPSALPEVTRPITLTGTLFDLMENDTFSMKTSFGTFQLALVDGQTELQKSLESLFNQATGTSPKVELVIQPGMPPKDATLIIPSPEKIERLSKSEDTIDKSFTSSTPASLQSQTKAEGETHLKITVLPDKIKVPIKAEEGGHEKATDHHLVSQTKEQQGTKLHDPSKMTDTIDGDTTSALTDQKIVSASIKSGLTATNKSLEPGQSYQLKITQTLPHDAEWPAEPTPSTMLRATVVGKSLTGQLILQSEDQTLISHVKSDLPVGTKIVAQIIPEGKEPLTILLRDNEKDFLPLRNIVETMQSISPKGAEAFLHMRVPNPSHHFVATTMFLLSALHGGKIDEWLGPSALHVLEHDKRKGLKEKLIDSIKDTLDSSPQDRTVGEWKAYPIPLHFEGAYELLNLYVHNDKNTNRESASSAAQAVKTRFVITMNMSRLGPIQLDGLSQRRQLDLIIRSEIPLPPSLASTLRETAIASLEAVGLVGTLSIQSGRQNWINFEDVKTKPAPLIT